MFINNFDPVAFEIFSLEIRWYSLAYIFGILIGWFLCKKFFIKEKNINDNFDDFITFVIFGILIGGRLGYVLIYDIKYYLSNPFEIIMIWKGGMSFHGGVIGIILATLIFCKKRNQNVFQYLDLVSLVAPIGIFFGRLANFINSELYGNITGVPWGVKFIKVDNFYRHPSQLYEAFFEGIILFLILLFLFKKEILKKPGIISSIFLIIYSFFRFILEFYRSPDEHLGYQMFDLTQGQLISIIFILIGMFCFLKSNK